MLKALAAAELFEVSFEIGIAVPHLALGLTSQRLLRAERNGIELSQSERDELAALLSGRRHASSSGRRSF